MKEQKKKDDICFSVNKKGKHVNGWENFFRIVLAPFVKLLFPYKVYGNKKVPDGPMVFVGNHYRAFDILYPAMLTWEGVHFLAKNTLSKSKFFNYFFGKFRVIGVNRDGNDVRGVMNAIKCLRHGDKVSLYPEGTRNKTDQEILPFFSGASMFAIKAKVPVVPITIYKKQRAFHRAHILVGDPVEFTEFYDKKLTEDVLKEADEKLKALLLGQRYAHEKMLEAKRK